jgi:hypothetical protein
MNARKKRTNEYALFDVLYEDGTRTSNRKIPLSELEGDDSDLAAKAFVEAQDRKIAEASGMPRGGVKSVARVRR